MHRPVKGQLGNHLSGSVRLSTGAIGNVFIELVPLKEKLLTTLKFCCSAVALLLVPHLFSSSVRKELPAAPVELLESDISLFAFLNLIYFLLNNFSFINYSRVRVICHAVQSLGS